MTSAPRFFLSRRGVFFAVGALALMIAVSVAAFRLVATRVETILNAHHAAIVDSEVRYLQILDAERSRSELVRFVARLAASESDDLPIHALVSEDGAYLAGDVDWPNDLIIDGRWRPIETFRRSRGEPVSGFARAVRLSDGATVLIGRDRNSLVPVQSALAEAILLTLVGIVTVGVATIALLNYVVLGRIDAIVSTARGIIAGKLNERIPLQGQSDELSRLADILNVMLDANAAHIERVRIVTEAIAHDLRLPLQRVKTNLERAYAAQVDSGAARAVAAAEGEIDQALVTFNGLIEIVRAESGIGSEVFDDIDLAALVRDVVELFEPVAEDKSQILRTETAPMKVRGQSALLRQALGNLIHNAIKFSPEGTTVTVRIQSTDLMASLIVEDNGPGIPEQDRAAALRPFGRLARDDLIDGKGLGLALAAACAKLHDGQLRLESGNPGLRVILSLPRAREGT